jgi:S1-C subfamily serine protease
MISRTCAFRGGLLLLAALLLSACGGSGSQRNIQYAEQAIEMRDWETAFRRLADEAANGDDAARAERLLRRYPELKEGGKRSFSLYALRASRTQYGARAAEQARARLKVYRQLVNYTDYIEAERNYRSVFGSPEASAAVARGLSDPASTGGIAGAAPATAAVLPRAGYASGTGWPLRQGLVVTNNHVVRGARRITLVRRDGKRIPATLEVADPANDLALLRPERTNDLPAAMPLGRSARLGAAVFTIGYPNPDIMGSTPKLTTGTVNAVSGFRDDPRLYQVSVPTQRGNSGGPLINMRGEVVGVITSRLGVAAMLSRTGEIPVNVNYAVKVEYLSPLIRRADAEPIRELRPQDGRNLERLAEVLEPSVLRVIAE